MYSIKISFLLLLLYGSLQAQGLQLGFGIGKSVYWGDLNSSEFSSNINNNGGLALQIFGKYNYKTRGAVKTSILFGKLAGSDAFQTAEDLRIRNLSFRSNIFEFSILGEYYFFGYDPFAAENVFSPYVSFGVAGFYFNPIADYQGNSFELQPLGTEGQGNPGYGAKYKKFNAGIPFGAGAVFRLNQSMDITFDIIARKTFTDYIDDLSGSYVNYNELAALNGPIAAALADRTNEYLGLSEPLIRETGFQRGGKLVKDWYFTAMFGFGFTLTDYSTINRRKSNYRPDCPKF
ncbi:MAG: hypothetical protein RLZZ546_932 [Bacteroidota bacterium]|jgi:hypothetical protein